MTPPDPHTYRLFMQPPRLGGGDPAGDRTAAHRAHMRKAGAGSQNRTDPHLAALFTEVLGENGRNSVADSGEIESQTFTVYRFYDVADDLLYVGRSARIEDRLGAHRRGKPWWRDIARIELDHFDTWTQMVRAETWGIKHLRPRYNIALNPEEAEVVWDERTPSRAKREPYPFLMPDEILAALGWSEAELEDAIRAGFPTWRFAKARRFKWLEVQDWLMERGA